MDGSVGVRLDVWLRRRPWVADGALAVALALVLAPTSVSPVLDAGWPLAGRLATLGVLAALHGALAVRRGSPLVAYGVACLAMLVLVTLPDVHMTGTDGADQSVPPILLPSCMVWPVALHAAAAYPRRPRPLATLGVGLVGAVLTAVRLTMPGAWLTGALPSVGGGWRVFVVVALFAAVIAPWGLGRFHGVRAAYARELRDRARREAAERARHAVAEERTRIAREMHDVVAHSLAVMVRLAEGGRFAGRQDPRVAVEALAAVADTGRQALGDMRAVMAALRRGDAPDGDDGTGGPGPVPGPQPTVADLAALVDRVRRTGLSVQLRTEGSPRPLDRVASLAAYRVVQESLTNAVKHAGRAVSVAVDVTWADRELVITVTDDGGGPAHDDVPGATAGDPPGGLGLIGMHERVTLAGGRLSTGWREDGAAGFAVRAWLPYRRDEGAT